MLDSRLRVVVAGWLIREPTAGIAWVYLNYVHGLAGLGHEVYYIEDSDDNPTCYGPDLSGPTTDPSYGLRFASEAFARLGLGDRWAYYDAHTNHWKGARAHDARALCDAADLVLHVSAFQAPVRDWLQRVPVRALVDIDPGFTQVLNLTDSEFRQRCRAYTTLFSFGENLGKASCRVPDDGFLWQPTRPPVSLSAWPYSLGPQNGHYTTIMQWQSYPAAWEYDGVRLASKSESFSPFLALPDRVGRIFEIAVRARWDEPFSALRKAGWGIADIDAVSRDLGSYQAFIQASKAEFGIAKAGYVDTRCGWFSDRSAAYLASGRPVLHQDTGFPEWLPCGEGVLAFRSPDDVVDAVARVDSNYANHCRAARELAAEYFSANHVLSQLIERAMTRPIPSATNNTAQ